MKEVSANGETEETRKVEKEQQEDDEKVVVESGEVHLVKVEDLVDENDDVKEVEDVIQVKENATPTLEENSGFLEEIQEVVELNGIVEPLPVVSAIRLEDPEVNDVVESAVTKQQTADLNVSEDKKIEALTQSNGANGDVLDPGVLNGDKEVPPVPFLVADNNIEVDLNASEDEKIEHLTARKDELSQVEKDVVLNEGQEEILAIMEQKDGVGSASTDHMERNGIEEAKIEVSAIKYDYPESDAVVNKDFVRDVGDLSETDPINVTIIGSSDASPATTANPTIISISHCTVPPTSWKSCCGIFDVLRRSNR